MASFGKQQERLEIRAIQTLHRFCGPTSSGGGRSPIIGIDELRMGLRATHRDENRVEPEARHDFRRRSRPITQNIQGQPRCGLWLNVNLLRIPLLDRFELCFLWHHGYYSSEAMGIQEPAP